MYLKDFFMSQRNVNENMQSRFGLLIRKAFSFAFKKSAREKEEYTILQLKADALSALLAEQEEKIRILERISRTDPLTRTLNRRGFNEEFETELSRADRTGKAGTLCLIDINRFKDINDRYNHCAGDEALIFIARYLQSFLRKTDRLARIGGDEFAIILTDCNRKKFIERMEKSEKDFQKRGFFYKNQKIPLSFSFGCASFDGSASAECIFLEADQNMYAHKHTGRNPCSAFLHSNP